MFRNRTDQHLFDIPMKLGGKKTRYHIGVAIGNHRHHNQARHDKLYVGDTAHIANARANHFTKDDKIQTHGDGRGQQCLRPNAKNAADFFD